MTFAGAESTTLSRYALNMRAPWESVILISFCAMPKRAAMSSSVTFGSSVRTTRLKPLSAISFIESLSEASSA